MTLEELLRAVKPLHVSGDTRIEVTDLSHDSRKISPGTLFFAIPGSKTDGNRYIKKACEMGAVAAVSELAPPPAPLDLGITWIQVNDIASAMGKMADNFFNHPSQSLVIFGVTGTNGKTTTTYFLESIIASCGGKPAVAGTVNYRLGKEWNEKAVNTTPSSLDLLRLLARFRDGGATHLAMEVSSHALALKRVEEIDFDAAIFTNLRRDHLDFHKTIEEYFRAKLRLFDLLGKTSSVKKNRVAVINEDDPRAAEMHHAIIGAQTLTYGLGPSSQVRAERIKADLNGTRFEIIYAGRKLQAQIALIGEYNIYNALAAAAAALGLGMKEEGVLAGLKALKQVPGRLEPVNAGQDFHLFVDYAHTDSALEAVLKCLRELPHQRIITVFGCGGERDRTKRGPMGLIACSLSDLTIITSDNPRSEDPLIIINDIEMALKTSGAKNYKILPDRKEAITQAVGLAKKGDVLLIAGKGHEDYQILKDGVVHFDDREVASTAIRNSI